jgi:hypothetical protein
MTVSILVLVTTTLEPGRTRHQLNPRIDGSFIPAFSDSAVFTPASVKVFVDGSSEFTPTAGEYSIDYDNGVVYSVSRTSATGTTTVSYLYEKREIVPEAGWDFVDQNGGIANAISIKDAVFESFKSDRETIAYAVKYFGLNHINAVKGTVSITGGYSGYLDKEVPFIDGQTELLAVIPTKEKLASFTAGAGEIVVISFSMPVSTLSAFVVDFTNTDVFETLEASLGAVTDIGDYFVDRSNNRVHVKVAGDVEDPGHVQYYYNDPNADLEGRYSINYETGEVYTYTATPHAGEGDDPAYIQYKYTDYRATYTVAREVPATDWEIDTTKNEITIADREILKNARLPQIVTSPSASKRYQCIYEYIGQARADVNELEPYFSPVVKDYGLRVITKDRLV